MKEKRNAQHVFRGSVLAYTLILLSVVLLAAIGIASVSVTNERGALLSNRSVSAFQVADTGAQAAIVAIREALSNGDQHLSDITLNGEHCFTNASFGYIKVEASSSGTAGGYLLSFYDKDDSQLRCNSNLSDIATVKSVGEYRDTSRAVKVAVVPYQLVGHWKLNETSGTTAADSSGKGNDGTLQNGPTWSGGALRFDGADDVVSISSNSSLDLTKQVSVSIWFNVTAFPTSLVPLVSKVNDNGCVSSRTYSVWLDGASQLIRLDTQDSGGGQRTLDTSANSVPSLSTWHHYVGVVDRVSGTLTAYIDGSEDGTDSFSPADAVSNSDPVRLGGSFTGGASCSPSEPAYGTFDGMIDDVRIYRGVLSQATIVELYANGRQ